MAEVYHKNRRLARRSDGSAVVETRYRVRIKNRKNAIMAPLMPKPASASFRGDRRSKAMVLTRKATGVDPKMVSPPRAFKGLLHPGWKTTIRASTVQGVSDNRRPTRPRVHRRLASGGISTGFAGSDGISWSGT
jgi:hypothetical protein